MSFDLQEILESKRTLRRNLAARPVAEKLRMLDQLRERVVAIRNSVRPVPGTPVLHEEPLPYGKSDKPG